jgi:hypothetical protein
MALLDRLHLDEFGCSPFSRPLMLALASIRASKMEPLFAACLNGLLQKTHGVVGKSVSEDGK